MGRRGNVHLGTLFGFSLPRLPDFEYTDHHFSTHSAPIHFHLCSIDRFILITPNTKELVIYLRRLHKRYRDHGELLGNE